MKKRDIVMDLTVFIDVVLVLMFLVLTQNTGEMYDYRAQLYEAENQLAALKQDADEMAATLDGVNELLADVNERLAAVSDWNNDRLGLMDELGPLQEQMELIRDAVHFVFISMHIENHSRVLHIEAAPNVSQTFGVVWLASENRIVNSVEVAEWVRTIISNIAETIDGEHPIMIMLNYTGIARQEYSLIVNAIRYFDGDDYEEHNIFYSSHTNN